MTPWAAKWAACWLEPHCRSTVVPGTVSGQPGREHGVAGDVDRLLAHLHHAAHHDVVDDARVDAVAIDERFQRLGGEVDRMPVAKLAVALAQRRAHGVDDHSVAHGANRTRRSRRRPMRSVVSALAGATLSRTPRRAATSRSPSQAAKCRCTARR